MPTALPLDVWNPGRIMTTPLKTHEEVGGMQQASSTKQNSQQLNSDDLRALAKIADKFTKKNYDLNILKQHQQYPHILHVIQDHFKNLERRKILSLPELNYENQVVGVFSDYGGESKDSRCFTYSFLVCSLHKTDIFDIRMAAIRQKYGLGDKEISFKDLNYGPLNRALDDYLVALNFVPGLLFTIVIEKGADPIPTVEIEEIIGMLKEEKLGEWKPSVIEKLLRVCLVAAYLVSLLIGKGQKVFWMTDNDSIVANDVLTKGCLTVFANLLSNLSKCEISRIGGGPPFKERHLQTLDLLSSADIVAGSMEHCFTRASNDFEDIKTDVDKVLVWLCHDGLLLKKQNVMIMKADPQGVRTG